MTDVVQFVFVPFKQNFWGGRGISNPSVSLLPMGSSSHYNDVIMSAMMSQITSLKIVYSAVYSGADQRKHQSSASLAFVWGLPRWPGNSPHKGPVTRKMFPFDDVIMSWRYRCNHPGESDYHYRKTSSINRTKSQSLNVSCILVQLSSFNPLKPGVKLRMKM